MYAVTWLLVYLFSFCGNGWEKFWVFFNLGFWVLILIRAVIGVVHLILFFVMLGMDLTGLRSEFVGNGLGSFYFSILEMSLRQIGVIMFN